jgi:hypothetical protein
VSVGTKIFQQSAGQHCVPGPHSAHFCLFQHKGDKPWAGMHVLQPVGAKKSAPPTPIDPFTPFFFYKYNIKPPYKWLESVEKNRESFQECFEQKISLKQTLLFKVLKLLKVEKSFRFNSPFIIFGTKTWKIFALKLFLN